MQLLRIPENTMTEEETSKSQRAVSYQIWPAALLCPVKKHS